MQFVRNSSPSSNLSTTVPALLGLLFCRVCEGTINAGQMHGQNQSKPVQIATTSPSRLMALRTPQQKVRLMNSLAMHLTSRHPLLLLQYLRLMLQHLEMLPSSHKSQTPAQLQQILSTKMDGKQAQLSLHKLSQNHQRHIHLSQPHMIPSMLTQQVTAGRHSLLSKVLDLYMTAQAALKDQLTQRHLQPEHAQDLWLKAQRERTMASGSMLMTKMMPPV